jgi:hypothetical protein
MSLRSWIISILISLTALGCAADVEGQVPKQFIKPQTVEMPKIKSGYAYQKFTMLFILPSYGLGYRQRNGNFGYDISVTISPFLFGTARGAFLAFIGNKAKPRLPFFGLGITALAVTDIEVDKVQGGSKFEIISQGYATLILGHEQKNGFFELDLGLSPFELREGGIYVMLSKGWKF